MELQAERTTDPIIIAYEESKDEVINISKIGKKLTVEFGFSRKRHLPVIWVAGITNFRPYRLDLFLKYRGFTLTKIDDRHVVIGKNGFEFVLTPEYALIMIQEFINWKRDYKVPFSLKNKTILDIGAGCGESVFYFALKGCRNFIAVEPNTQCANLLRKNAKNNRP